MSSGSTSTQYFLVFWYPYTRCLISSFLVALNEQWIHQYTTNTSVPAGSSIKISGAVSLEQAGYAATVSLMIQNQEISMFIIIVLWSY